MADEFRQLPKIAILHSAHLSRSQIYQAGFQDYVMHPFVKEEVLYRIITSIRQSVAAPPAAHFSAPEVTHLSQSGLPGSAVPNDTKPLHQTMPRTFTQNPVPRIDQHQVLIEKACVYMQANLAKRLTLALVAKQTGTSRTKLAALFQSRLNTTVFEWLREQRMLRAESLLLQSNLQIQQIAYAVGYDNPANFATCYRQHFQRSPSASRKNRTLAKGFGTTAKANDSEQV